MIATLFPESNFLYAVDGKAIHMYYQGTLTKNVTMSQVHTHINMGNMHGERVKVVDGTMDECISELQIENTKVYCKQSLEVVLDKTYSLELRKRHLELLISQIDEILNLH